MNRTLPSICLLLAACSSSTAPDDPMTEAVIMWGAMQAPVVTLPGAVDTGQSFTVDVTTFGSDSCWRAGDDEIVMGDGRVTITLFDESLHGPGVGCFLAIREIPHSIELTLTSPGQHWIVIRGRQDFGGPIISVVRPVMVE